MTTPDDRARPRRARAREWEGGARRQQGSSRGARGCKLCNRGKERVAGTVTGVCAPSAGPPVTFEETSMEEITTLSTLRRDGFCSLYAPDDAAEADTITRPLVGAFVRRPPSPANFCCSQLKAGTYLHRIPPDTILPHNTSQPVQYW